MATTGAVVAVELYNSDAVVVRRGRAPDTKDALRSEVTEFSKKSRRRLAFVAANTSVVFRTMVTLTYPRVFPHDGATVKLHLRRFLQWLRRDTGGCDVLWFLEFQRRGAPHVHILIDWAMPKTMRDKMAMRFRVAATWYRFCGTGDEKHLRAGTRVEALRSARGGARYAVKYAQKMRQKRVPKEYRNVGRFWGHTRAVKPMPLERIELTEDDVRAVLDGWQYAPDDDRTVWRVLYNCSNRFDDYQNGRFDKLRDEVYTVAKRQADTETT